MLLVQNVTDDVKKNRLRIETAVDAYLRDGGRIQRVGTIHRTGTHGFNNSAGHRHTSGARAAADLDAKMSAALPFIIKRHRAGEALSRLAKDYSTTSPTVKQYLLNAGEDPHANIKNHDVSYDQLLAIKAMAEGGAPKSEIAEWTGLPPERVDRTVKEFKFKRI